jgi:hypothetical protein
MDLKISLNSSSEETLFSAETHIFIGIYLLVIGKPRIFFD